MSIKHKLIIPIVLILVITAAQLYLIINMINMQQEDAELVNLAGRQRMLSQNIFKNAFAYIITKDGAYADAMKDAMNTFDKSLNVMINGGNIEFGGKQLNIEPTRNSEIQAALMEVKECWDSKRGLLTELINNPDKFNNPAKISEINETSLELLSLSHKVTGLYQYNSNATVKNSMMVIYFTLALYVAGAVLTWVVVQRDIVNPIIRLRDAAQRIARGDLS